MGRISAKDLLQGAKNNKSMHDFLQGQHASQNTSQPPATPKRKATSPAALQNVNENESSLKEICKGINAINEKLSTMQNSIDDNNQLISIANTRCFQNEEKIEHLSTRTNALDQKQLNDRLEISGITGSTFNANLNIKTQVVKFLKEMLIEIEPVEIANAYLMKRKVKEQEEKIFCVVIFLHEAIKSRVMKRKMELKSGPAVQYFFNEVLTPLNRKLIYSARQLKKAGKFSNAGTMNGQVYVKKTPEGAKIFINSICEMEELGKMSNDVVTNNLQKLNNRE